MNMKKAVFTLDIVENEFNGLSLGETWNGWACPLFPESEAKKVAKMYKEELGGTVEFKNDEFIFIEPDYEPEVFPAIMINEEKYYPIGSGSWCWVEEVN